MKTKSSTQKRTTNRGSRSTGSSSRSASAGRGSKTSSRAQSGDTKSSSSQAASERPYTESNERDFGPHEGGANDDTGVSPAREQNTSVDRTVAESAEQQDEMTRFAPAGRAGRSSSSSSKADRPAPSQLGRGQGQGRSRSGGSSR